MNDYEPSEKYYKYAQDTGCCPICQTSSASGVFCSTHSSGWTNFCWEWRKTKDSSPHIHDYIESILYGPVLSDSEWISNE